MLIWLLFFISIVAANLPWLNKSFLIFKTLKKPKKLPVIFIEIVCMYFLLGLIFFFVEKKSIGNVHSQDWEFYAVTFFLFLVFSFPGFIYKVIWK
ncbi:DUF2818 family protein [Methylophilaceae bacterium]|nr:DUF2818 family protein [Methylophilaceae bacterium]MDA9155359.1 DUF2818 family protein [Methylophilaceae bacterium]|tara:strand:+ start:114 stop:398 length:285 start_codon:yes stop_codon:yes gene_type:complete